MSPPEPCGHATKVPVPRRKRPHAPNCYDDSIVSMTPALRAPGKTSFAYTHVVFFGLLILLCYAPAVRSLIGDWMHDDDMGHGFFVPAVAAYIIWQQRDEL